MVDRLSRAHKAAQVGAFEWNLHTNELLWSEDMYRIHHMTREQFDGRFETWAKTIHPDDLDSVLAKIQKCVDDKSEFHTEYRCMNPHGEIRSPSGSARGRRVLRGARSSCALPRSHT